MTKLDFLLVLAPPRAFAAVAFDLIMVLSESCS
jgi:hypothetical protein